MDSELQIDDIDRKIILDLQNDGCLSSKALAKRHGISISTASRRVRRLVAEDVINITAVPNPAKLGYRAVAIIALGVELTNIDKVCDTLVSHPNIHFVGVSLGRFDILIVVHLKTSEELVDFLKRTIAPIEGVTRVETFSIAQLRKRTFGWMVRD